MRGSSTTGRVALLIASVAVTLALAELGLRALRPEPSATSLRDLHVATPDRPWLYELVPSSQISLPRYPGALYAINADGFRDAPRSVRKPPGVFRVLVLGDSVAFGIGVAQQAVFTRRLEEELSRRLPAEVLNFGVGGYNPYNEAALFAARGVAYEPDLVLVQFCINDLNDPTLHFDVQTRDRLGELPAAAFPNLAARLAPPRDPLLSFCPGWRLCRMLDAAFEQASGDDAKVQRATFAPLLDLTGRPERRWIADRYAEMASSAAAIGARFAVLAFPYRPQVKAGTKGLVQEQLVELGEERGWVTLDLLPAFREAQRRDAEPLFLDLWHPNEAGHRVAAAAIERGLDRLDWLPERARRASSE